MATRVVLVSCVKTKRKSAVASADMYISPLFKGMRRYAEKNADAWFILSAEHGVLRTDQVIAPYERSMKMPERSQVAWAERVNRQLLELLPTGATVIILAGIPYRKRVVPFLESHGFTVEVPMFGLKQGLQLRWLNQQI